MMVLHHAGQQMGAADAEVSMVLAVLFVVGAA
jgi:hypothetical protein